MRAARKAGCWEREVVGGAIYRTLGRNAHDLSCLVTYVPTRRLDASSLWRVQLRSSGKTSQMEVATAASSASWSAEGKLSLFVGAGAPPTGQKGRKTLPPAGAR